MRDDWTGPAEVTSVHGIDQMKVGLMPRGIESISGCRSAGWRVARVHFNGCGLLASWGVDFEHRNEEVPVVHQGLRMARPNTVEFPHREAARFIGRWMRSYIDKFTQSSPRGPGHPPGVPPSGL